MALLLTSFRKFISLYPAIRNLNQAPNSASTTCVNITANPLETAKLIAQPQPSHPFNRAASLHPPNPPHPRRPAQPCRHKSNPRHLSDKAPLHQYPRHPPTLRRPRKRSLLRSRQRRLLLQNCVQGGLGDPQSDRVRDMADTFTGGGRQDDEG